MSDLTSVSVVIPVYRDATRALGAVAAILDQALPADASLEVIVVDDGSGDDTTEQLARLDDPRVRLLALPDNVGRSAARNAGAMVARGAALVFMDCDCLPADDHFIAAHLRALRDAVATTGRVAGDGAGFWDRYQREASMRRERQHAAGVAYAGSSQNLAVCATAFTAVGGFDTGYRQYGFEDRDLLIRLGTQGRIEWTARAEVRHMDALTLQDVTEKMMVGQHSSARFAIDHPKAYQALGYAALDARLHRWLRLAGIMAAPVVRAAATRIDHSRVLERLPYPAARILVRAVCAMAYLAGTSLGTRRPLNQARPQ